MVLMRKSGVAGKYDGVVEDMYESCETVVRWDCIKDQL